MKWLVVISAIASLLYLNGCYTVLSASKEDAELTSNIYNKDEENQSYFDEEYIENENFSSTDSGYNIAEESEYANQETETEFNFGVLISEVIAEFFNAGLFISEISADYTDSSSTENNSNKERENSSQRHTGSRNYDGR